MKTIFGIPGNIDEIELSQKIGILFILNKVYLQKDLKLDDFAKKIGISTRHLAPVFGLLYGHRFRELTNMYRVEYAKNKIEAGYLNDSTLKALSDLSGFSSQSNFIKVFKKEFGKCPHDYGRPYSPVT